MLDDCWFLLPDFMFLLADFRILNFYTDTERECKNIIPTKNFSYSEQKKHLYFLCGITEFSRNFLQNFLNSVYFVRVRHNSF